MAYKFTISGVWFATNRRNGWESSRGIRVGQFTAVRQWQQILLCRDHRGAKEQNRQDLGCVLVGWHIEPAGGDRTDHLSVVHSPPR
ncbi:MAG: hypothetical protein JW384_01235 [Nitrosomonadaceae bacterium]|nr:hypothetical protein [Nitrosomonadaceae bacterium]